MSDLNRVQLEALKWVSSTTDGPTHLRNIMTVSHDDGWVPFFSPDRTEESCLKEVTSYLGDLEANMMLNVAMCREDVQMVRDRFDAALSESDTPLTYLVSLESLNDEFATFEHQDGLTFKVPRSEWENQGKPSFMAIPMLPVTADLISGKSLVVEWRDL